MAAPIRSILHTGSGGLLVDVECHISNGLPGIIVVGLGNKAVDEARERVRSAFANSRIRMPRQRITINLAPADIPKDSTSLDVAIALAILQNSGQIKKQLPGDICAVIGELGLDGRVRAVRGIIGQLLAGKQQGITTFLVPAENVQQASLVPDIKIMPMTNLCELYTTLASGQPLEPYETGAITVPSPPESSGQCLDDIIGQSLAKRALVVGAAGGHNIFLSGAPGTGKSMLAHTLARLLPPLSQEEVLEITHIYSLINTNYGELITSRPFRSPHHSISHAAMVGGGARIRPGEITLSHRGVLFLDEMPEFSRPTIEALRQPLENHNITVARAKDTATYPADFILIATANPCPCGFYGTGKPCDCTAQQIVRYRQKLSGPILDRIDLYVETEPITHAKLLQAPEMDDITEAGAKTAIRKARERQAARFGSAKLNGTMNNKDIKVAADISTDAQSLLNNAADQLQLSARGYMRIIKVARTIADLDNAACIKAEHMAEAIQYRPRHAKPLA